MEISIEVPTGISPEFSIKYSMEISIEYSIVISSEISVEISSEISEEIPELSQLGNHDGMGIDSTTMTVLQHKAYDDTSHQIITLMPSCGLSLCTNNTIHVNQLKIKSNNLYYDY